MEEWALPQSKNFLPKEGFGVYCDECQRSHQTKHGSTSALKRLAEGTNKL